jgi:hypothetical protein
MTQKNISVFVLLNFAAFAVPVYITGCGSANQTPAAAAITASNGTGTSGSGTSGSGSSGSGTPGSGTSGSGSSGSGSSGSGSSGSGSSGSGSSGSGSSGSGSSGSGSSGSGGSGSGGSGSGGSGSGSLAPASALAVNSIQKLSNWEDANDTGVGSGTSTGEMSVTDSPSRSGAAREFVTGYTDSGGERYWVTFGADDSTTNFLYDTWIYIANSASEIGNLELDMNQVVANGNTIIYGFQCDGYSGTWDYTENAGTVAKTKAHWLHATAKCNPRSWSTNTWHHVQVEYSRDDSGNVTYKSVWLDGTKQDINATVPSAFGLGWAQGDLLTNFQVDGLGASGKPTVYVDNMTIYRW